MTSSTCVPGLSERALKEAGDGAAIGAKTMNNNNSVLLPLVAEQRPAAAHNSSRSQISSQPRSRSPAEALATLRRNGVSIAEWARCKGFNPRLVYQVLAGNRKCLRGESFDIAKELGMK